MGKPAGVLDTSTALRERAPRVYPRLGSLQHRLDGPRPFIERAKGAWLWGVDGETWVDYLLGHSLQRFDLARYAKFAAALTRFEGALSDWLKSGRYR